jgi:hypothetical protein
MSKLKTHNQECIFPVPHRRSRSNLREENQLLAERLSRMEAFLTTKAATQRTMTSPESVDLLPSQVMVHEPLMQVSDSAPQVRASFNSPIHSESGGAMQSI